MFFFFIRQETSRFSAKHLPKEGQFGRNLSQKNAKDDHFRQKNCFVTENFIQVVINLGGKKLVFKNAVTEFHKRGPFWHEKRILLFENIKNQIGGQIVTKRIETKQWKSHSFEKSFMWISYSML